MKNSIYCIHVFKHNPLFVLDLFLKLSYIYPCSHAFGLRLNYLRLCTHKMDKHDARKRKKTKFMQHNRSKQHIKKISGVGM